MHRISACLASFLSLACLGIPASAYELEVQNSVNVWRPSSLPPPAFVQLAAPVQVQVNVKVEEDADCGPILYAHGEAYPGYVGGHLADAPY